MSSKMLAVEEGDTPVEYHLPPPLMGEHTADVLRELMEGKYKKENAK